MLYHSFLEDQEQKIKFINNLSLSVFVKTKRIIDEYAKDEFKYYFVINNFNFVINDFQELLVERIGYNFGECVYFDFDRLCPETEYYPLDLKFEHDYKIMYSYEHSHLGNWQTKYINKNGYDYIVMLFVFRNKNDADYASTLYLLKYGI